MSKTEIQSILLDHYLLFRERIIVSLGNSETNLGKNLNHSVYSDVGVIGVSLKYQDHRFKDQKAMSYLFKNLVDIDLVTKRSYLWLVGAYVKNGLDKESAEKLASQDVVYFSTVLASWILYRTAKVDNAVLNDARLAAQDFINFWYNKRALDNYVRDLLPHDAVEKLLLEVDNAS